MTLLCTGIFPSQVKELKGWPANLSVWLTRTIAIGNEAANAAKIAAQPQTYLCSLKVVVCMVLVSSIAKEGKETEDARSSLLPE